VHLLRNRDGQASVELVAVLPLVALLIVVLWQVAIAGEAVWLVGSAARAAARARAVGADTTAAARAVLPLRFEPGLRTRSATDGAVTVIVAVPLVVGAGRLTTVSARARFEPQGG
jgi:hypothetical protein